MIPKHIKMEGFLSYREEQEIDFDGSPLWMLSGPNGSGKSGVFDAMTYAVFGYHRGGQQQSIELINKESKGLSVEFDFRIDRQLYRIKRTLKLTPKGTSTGTQQIYEWHGAAPNAGNWTPIPDTTRRAEFDNWVRDKIGLTYETFTSSVLLLQGKAEKLLDSKPSGRAEVLAGIVDLERYQRLHERADNRRRELKARVEALQNQFNNVPDVTDFDLAAAQGKLDEAVEAGHAATAEVERLHVLESEAKQWTEAHKRHAGLRDRHKQAETLLASSAQIERDYRRLSELQLVLPHILNIQRDEASIAESLDKSKKVQAERDLLDQKKRGVEHALDLDRKKRTSLQKSAGDDERKLKNVETELRALAGQLEKLKQLERQQSDVKDLEAELGKLPADPENEVRRLQALHDQRVEQAQALPVLDRFQQNRADLSQARQRLEKAETKATEIQRTGKKAADESKALREQANAATKARAEADDRATQSRTLMEQAEADVNDVQSLTGKKKCRHCGQPLTETHMREEKKRRQHDLAEAQQRHQEALAAQKSAQSDEMARIAAADKREKEHRKLQQDYRECRRDVDEARKEAERTAKECEKAYLSLAESFRLKIAATPQADWLKCDYPSRADVSAVRKEAGDSETVRADLEKAREHLTNWTGLQAQHSAAKVTRDRLRSELGDDDPAALHERHASLRGEEESLTSALKACKATLSDTEAGIDRGMQEMVKVGNRINDLDTGLASEDVNRKHFRESIARAQESLPEAWREDALKSGFADQHQWKQECDNLIAAGVEKRYEDLASARVGVEQLNCDIAEAEQQLARFPEEARQAPEQLASLRLAAKNRVAECDQVLKEAQQAKSILDRDRQQREQIRIQLLDMEREHNYFILLAQLLGRDRLQRHLVRVAERQIVDYANGVLDRLSGGQLFLRLCGEEGAATDRALDLEACNRTTRGSAINVAFLSGSQRFRVAVSLALGIGQYASRQHRPIESVIIDEGFGCLDRQGRQVMIQELQNLRGQLQCILLVSHQEEFADAFPDGYRFDLAEGATRVRRLQR